MRKQLILPLLILCSFAALVSGQESLVIGAGDQIHVQVFDTPEMDQHPRVTDAGTVPLLFVGDVKVAGLAPGEAAHAIEAVLQDKQYMLHPHVAVTIEDYANEQISIMGQVKDGGVYQITAPTPILTVLSMAGGLTELADRHVTVQRHGNSGEKITFFLSNTSEQAFNQKLLVYPGDTVYIPKAGVVYVMGDVGRPGGYPIITNDQKMSILQAVTLAGTVNHTAVVSKARLIRKTENGLQDIQVDLASIQTGKKPDIQMLNDDILFVPFSWMKNAMLASSAIATSATSALIYAHP
jgi:polysaccharide export outer membrane protein